MISPEDRLIKELKKKDYSEAIKRFREFTDTYSSEINSLDAKSERMNEIRKLHLELEDELGWTFDEITAYRKEEELYKFQLLPPDEQLSEAIRHNILVREHSNYELVKHLPHAKLEHLMKLSVLNQFEKNRIDSLKGPLKDKEMQNHIECYLRELKLDIEYYKGMK